MGSLLRMFLVSVALLSGGVAQVATSLGDDACCTDEAGEQEEQGEPCPDCPPGLACGCCPARGVTRAEAPTVPPASSRGVAVTTAAREPDALAAAGDIFHPPRA